MNVLWAALTIVGSSFAFIQSKPDEPKPAQPYLDAGAYEVYSAIVPNEWMWRYTNGKTLLIKSETVSYQMCLAPDEESKKLIGSAIANFIAVNQKPWILDRKLQIGKPYQLVAGDLLEAPFKKAGANGWAQFKLQHPDSVGWIELSAVGFNEDETIAVVYSGHHCGGLCGGGQFSVLAKSNGQWKPLSWSGGQCFWAS